MQVVYGDRFLCHLPEAHLALNTESLVPNHFIQFTSYPHARAYTLVVMDSILEQKPDYAFCQFEADPFKFPQEFGSAVDTSVIDPSFSSQGFYFPAESVTSSSYATDNDLPIQPLHDLGLDWQTPDVLGMQNDAFTQDFSQVNSFGDASLPLSAFDMMSLHSNTVAPLVDPYDHAFQPLDLDDALISPPTARALPSNSQFAVPITRSLMRGRKAATNAYQYPQFAPMAYATPHQAAQAPYFNATFGAASAMGYGMQPAAGPYSSMSAPAVNVNIQLPSDQTLTNNFPVQQQPVAYPSYSYSHTMAAMPSSQPGENWDFVGQGIYSEHLMQPSPCYIPAAFDSRGSTSSCGSDFPPHGDEGGVSGVQASPQKPQHSSVIRGRANRSRTDKRLRGSPYPKISAPRPITQRMTTESIVDPDGDVICCWGGCGERFVDADKATYQRHLLLHGVRTFGQTITICKWIDPENGEECGKPLQMQSMLKHVCGRTHLNLLSKMCPLCKVHQARGSNIHRHWLSCFFFIELDEEEQKRLWSEYSKKPFDWYLEQQETRGVIPSSSTT